MAGHPVVAGNKWDNSDPIAMTEIAGHSTKAPKQANTGGGTRTLTSGAGSAA